MRACARLVGAVAAACLLAVEGRAQIEGFGPGAEKQQFSVQMTVESPAQAPGGTILANLAFACPPEWYIYADKISVAPAAGGVSVTVDRVVLPQVKQKFDKLLNERVRYLDGRFTVQAVLKLGAGAPEGEQPLRLRVGYQGCNDVVCFLPATAELERTVRILPAGAGPAPAAEPAAAPEQAPAAESQRGLLGLLVLAYLGGLGLAATPCIWPLIPITIGVIGAAGGAGRAQAFVRSLTYVLGIAVMYALLGVIAGSTGRVLGSMLQHPAVYVALAAIMALLAGSMFDLFTFQLAGSWTARVQARLRGRAGLAGVFALGLLSGIAATACTTPVVLAVLLPVLQTGSPPAGFLVMLVLGLGMGTPLVVAGTFAGALKALPRSGHWQDAVKHLFGLGLAGASLYFLAQSGLIGSPWFELLVGAALLSASVFAGAFDSLTDAADRFARARKAFGLLLLAGSVAAFLQPVLSESGAAGGAAPAGIAWVESLDQARAAAEAEGKPVMVYFWQEHCRACAELKEKTFPDQAVAAESRRFICASVDGTDWPPDVQERMRDQYGVMGFPTIAFVTTDGRIVKGRVGFLPPGELLRAMQAAR